MRIIVNNDCIRIDCPYCNSVLHANREDVVYDPVFGHGYYLYLYCGACGRKINISKEIIPDHWKAKIFVSDEDDVF